mmetsp:Transcript_21224/g.34530  ORF Transcript_21224/g.34530 Transcript_21224/m.34530 type:complete len:81 (-) Transcript_21224:331-573(-)
MKVSSGVTISGFGIQFSRTIFCVINPNITVNTAHTRLIIIKMNPVANLKWQLDVVGTWVNANINRHAVPKETVQVPVIPT